MKVLNNRYEVLDTVGQGAAAVVHRVRDQRDGSVKVAKLLHAASAASDQVVRRFEDEFRVLRGLHHPSLPEVFDYGWTQEPSRFMVMEFVEGHPLDQYMREHPEDLWVILYQLCEVLTFIHSHNLLHQDVKPGNILVKRTAAFGEELPLCVLIDFGLTHRRDAGEEVMMVGTPEYMAPEIIRGVEAPTRAVDYYSLGVTLYQLITGELPFQGSGRDIFVGHLHHEVQFERERIEYAELYPHIRGLMSKDERARLEAFEEFKRAVIGRMTGGIEELDKAYGLARINSLGMIGKDDAWRELMAWLRGLEGPEQGQFDVAVLRGRAGSGKSHLMSSLVVEAKIMGVNTAFVGRGDGNSAAGLPDHDDFWKALTSNGLDPALALIDDYASLDVVDHELLDHLRRRHAAATVDGPAPNVAVLIASSEVDISLRVSDDMKRQVQPSEHTIPPLSGVDHEAILGVFRGNILGASEIAGIDQLLSKVGDSAEAVLRGLQRAILEGSLSFTMGNWLVQPGVHDIDPVADNYYGEIVERLAVVVRDTAHVVSCHRGDVPIKVLAFGVGAVPETAQRACEQLEGLGLVVIKRSTDGSTARCVSDAVRERIYQSITPFKRDDLHRKLLSIIEKMLAADPDSAEQSSSLMGDAAGHAASIGDFRLAMRFLIRAVRTAAEDEHVRLVSDLVEFGFSICDRWDKTEEKPRAEAFRRYLIKAQFMMYWKRSMFDAIRVLVKERYADDVERVPTGFVPMYARALMFGGAADRAHSLLDSRMKAFRPESQPYLHMKVEQALIKGRGERVQEALSGLDDVSEHADRLSPYYRCRMYLHYLICYDVIGDMKTVAEMASRAEGVARSFGFVNELSVVLQARANVAFRGHRLSEAMSYISQGVRLSGKHKLEQSRKWFYFEASAVYYERGDLTRCERHLQSALRLSTRLGDLHDVAMCLTRSVMVYQLRGEYGNALKHLERAEKISPGMAEHDEGTLLILVRFEIGLDLNMDDTATRFSELSELMKGDVGLGRVGYFHLLRGHYLRALGKDADAMAAYRKAADTYAEVDQRDDEARAAIAAAWLALESVDFDDYVAWGRRLKGIVQSFDHQGIHAEYAMLELQHAAHSDDANLQGKASDCGPLLDHVSGALASIRANTCLFRVWTQLGDEEEASRAFSRFYATIKRIIANIPSTDVVNCFLAREDIAAMLQEGRRLT